MLLRLDLFNIINDTCDHVTGDELLRQLGDMLQKKVRQHDTLARPGGDQFGGLMEHCSLAQVRRVANELGDVNRQVILRLRGGSTYGVSDSIGLVPVTAVSEGITIVLSASDSACNVAKDAGCNRVHEFHAQDALMARRHDELQRVMHADRALQRNKLQLYYQPIISVTSSALEGMRYELMVRMPGDGGQMVAPGVFLPTVERFNLVPKFEHWVLNAALAWLTDHRAQLERTLHCIIALSGHWLVDDEVRRVVAQQLQAPGVPASKICFEVTEATAIVNMTQQATGFIASLKGKDCQFSLDDFGSGLSLFAYLNNLSVGFLKIHWQFVKDTADDVADLERVRAINGIGHGLGEKTIAEFVESKAILERLCEIGVDYAQGCGIGRPRSLDEVA
jgi:diguanylate cyclase (GGDEF)-like protein